MAGYCFGAEIKYESKLITLLSWVGTLLFGSLVLTFYCLLFLFSPIFEYVINEVGFQYKFHFTKYWEELLEGDEDKTAEEKIEHIKILSESNNVSKQFKRHAKMVYNKFK